MDSSIDLADQSLPAGQTAVMLQSIDASRSPPRAELAAAIAELAGAGVELAAVQEPATRLSSVIAEAVRLEAEFAALRADDQARLGSWLGGGGADLRPQPSPATTAAEKRLAAVATDASAARAALPAVERLFQRCAEGVREVQRRRDAALYGAAIDAARGFAQIYRTSLATALRHEAVLHSLREELVMRGNRSDAEPGAMDAAARIGDLIAQTKRDAAVRRDPEAGPRLLAALASDPDAVL